MVPFKLSIPHTKREAVNWSRQLGPQTKSLVVLHAMQWPERGNSAEWCGRFFAGLEGVAPKASAHFAVDADSIVECVAAERIAWHAPGANTHGIGIEHAGYARQTPAEWLDSFGVLMLDLSAKLTAELCRHFGIPPRFVDRTELRESLPGITTHAECSLAWGKSTHSDPGPGFPMREYLDMVHRYHRAIT
jgi:N-acetyl-anhydromuramyl-L-alanine amidase AmpD